MSKTLIVKTKIGLLKICYRNQYIYSAEFLDEVNDMELYHPNKQIESDIKNYFAGKPTDVASKILLRGTPFQIKVWSAIKKIPYGQTKTYGEIATEISENCEEHCSSNFMIFNTNNVCIKFQSQIIQGRCQCLWPK